MNYLQVKSTGYSTANLRVVTDSQEFKAFDVEPLVHDVEHLIHGLGFSEAEEDLIHNLAVQFQTLPSGVNYYDARNPEIDLSNWKDLFVTRLHDSGSDFVCEIAYMDYDLILAIENNKVVVAGADVEILTHVARAIEECDFYRAVLAYKLLGKDTSIAAQLDSVEDICCMANVIGQAVAHAHWFSLRKELSAKLNNKN
jgi:hypothetical protein